MADTVVDLIPTIQTQAGLPIASAADGQSATGRSSADIIAADVYQKNTVAVQTRRRRGLRMSRLSTPGAGPSGHPHGGGFSSGFFGW